MLVHLLLWCMHVHVHVHVCVYVFVQLLNYMYRRSEKVHVKKILSEKFLWC